MSKITIHASFILAGGGNVSYKDGRFKWDYRFIPLGLGGGAGLTTDGYLDFYMPTSGTTYGYANASATYTWTADGINLGNWETLYAIPNSDTDHGPFNSSSNYAVVGYSVPFKVPWDWIPICTRQDDTPTVIFVWASGGYTLKEGQRQSWGNTQTGIVDVFYAKTSTEVTTSSTTYQEVVSVNVPNMNTSNYNYLIVYRTPVRKPINAENDGVDLAIKVGSDTKSQAGHRLYDMNTNSYANQTIDALVTSGYTSGVTMSVAGYIASYNGNSVNTHDNHDNSGSSITVYVIAK